MNELVEILDKPITPDNWDYDESVKKTKAFLYKWKTLTVEFANELWIARDNLSKIGGDRKSDQWNKSSADFKTWSDYCLEIGSQRQIVNRWLSRWFTREINAGVTPELPTVTKGKYNIIYADPPWRYFEDGFKNQSQHYPTMLLEDICNLPVGDIAADDCLLFLWVTFPMLDNFMDVLRCWGFEYSTVGFVWVKSTKDKNGFAFGLGAWTRSNAEICVIARRGSIERQDASVSQIIYEPKGEHSQKPGIVKDKIVQLVGDLPRIELFARGQTLGWDTWGNEPTKFTTAGE